MARVDARSTARSLNRTKAAPSYRKLGFKSGDDVAGVYLSRNPKVMARNTTGLKTVRSQDRDVRRLAEWWSASNRNVRAVQSRPRPKDKYKLREIASGQATRQLRAARVNQLLDAAPKNAPTLYRGTVASPRKVRSMTPGKEIKLKPSSWTQDKDVPAYFSARAAKKHPEHRQMVMRLEPRSKALHVAPATRRKMAEWVGGGRYEVTGMKDRGSTVEVRVRQKGDR